MLRMKHAMVESIRANQVILFGPINFITCVEARVARKKRRRAPVTCKETSMALLSLIKEKNGMMKETNMKHIRMVQLASTDLLFMKDVRGIWL